MCSRWLPPPAARRSPLPPIPMPFASAGMAGSGAQFLQRRLQRAQQVPPEQRSPEVAAFVESEALLAEARQLLPLTQHGTAALPFNSSTKEAARQAMLLAARACYISPRDPATWHSTLPHFNAYVAPRPGRQLVNINQREDLLASVLAAAVSTPGSMCCLWLPWDLISRAAHRLTDPANQAALRRQLQRLTAILPRSGTSAQPAPLTLQQLHCLLSAQVVEAASELAAHAEQVSELEQSGRWAGVQEEARRYAALLLQLEPPNPRSYIAAAQADMVCNTQTSPTAVRLFMRALQLAREQGSDLQLARAGHGALVAAGLESQLLIGAAELEAVLAAHEEARAALRRCQRLLPGLWVTMVRRGLSEPAYNLVQVSKQ